MSGINRTKKCFVHCSFMQSEYNHTRVIDLRFHQNQNTKIWNSSVKAPRKNYKLLSLLPCISCCVTLVIFPLLVPEVEVASVVSADRLALLLMLICSFDVSLISSRFPLSMLSSPPLKSHRCHGQVVHMMTIDKAGSTTPPSPPPAITTFFSNSRPVTEWASDL